MSTADVPMLFSFERPHPAAGGERSSAGPRGEDSPTLTRLSTSVAGAWCVKGEGAGTPARTLRTA